MHTYNIDVLDLEICLKRNAQIRTLKRINSIGIIHTIACRVNDYLVHDTLTCIFSTHQIFTLN